MKRILVVLSTVLILAMSTVAFGAPPIPPAPTERVTDPARFLSDVSRQTLNARLAAYEHRSGYQVLVWIGSTTAETPLEDWTVRAFNEWRVGRSGLNDGLVLFVFAHDHRARIEVGYGLEGKVPDAVASRIINDAILPRIKAGDRDGAATSGVDQLLAALGGEDGTGTPAVANQPLGWVQILVLLIFAVVVVLLAIRYPVAALYVFSLLARRGSEGGGGFGGGGGRSGGGGASGKW